MNTPASAPLVSTTLEEAREKMISEGAVLIDRETRERELKEVFGNQTPWLNQLSYAFHRSPLTVIAGAFLIGTALGSRIGKGSSRF